MNEETQELDEQAMMRQAASLMGRRTSERKKQTSAANGKKGGRPKGTPQSEETREKIRQAHLLRSQEETEESSNG